MSDPKSSDTKIPILDLKPQYNALKTELQAAINRVLESGQFILGEDVRQLEQDIAQLLGVNHAIAVNSGTDALVISLRTLGIGPGDEVITTPFSFFATAESISNVGAKPVFADVDPVSFNLDPNQIAAQITPHTKAILPVHLFGQPAAMTAILELASQHNLAVIEDCAQAFGARYLGDCQVCQPYPELCSTERQTSLTGKYVGSLGEMGAFSFFPTKNLGAYGDGGLIITNDPQRAELATMLRVHGEKRRYHNQMLGYNSRMDTLQAAILRVKLPHIDQWNQQRRQIAQTYNQLLADVPGVVVPRLTPGHVFHQYTLRVLGGKRDFVHQSLAAEGITTMIYYPIPQDQLPIYQGQYPANPVSDQLATEVLSLPIWPELEASVQERVVEALRRALAAS